MLTSAAIAAFERASTDNAICSSEVIFSDIFEDFWLEVVFLGWVEAVVGLVEAFDDFDFGSEDELVQIQEPICR